MQNRQAGPFLTLPVKSQFSRIYQPTVAVLKESPSEHKEKPVGVIAGFNDSSSAGCLGCNIGYGFTATSRGGCQYVTRRHLIKWEPVPPVSAVFYWNFPAILRVLGPTGLTVHAGNFFIHPVDTLGIGVFINHKIPAVIGCDKTHGSNGSLSQFRGRIRASRYRNLAELKVLPNLQSDRSFTDLFRIRVKMPIVILRVIERPLEHKIL